MKIKLALSLAIAALCGLVYSNTLHAPFIFDDIPTIIKSEFISPVGPLSKYLDLPRGSPVSGRPVSALSFALNYAVGEINPFGYHLVNIAIHAAAALLLFYFLLLTLKLRKPEWLKDREVSFSFFTACLWALHPIQTEAVTYITQRTELLVGLFYFVTFTFFCRSFFSKRPFIWRALAVFACFLGMGSKEVMAACPLLVLFFDRVFIASSWKELFHRRKVFYSVLASSWLFLIYLQLKLPHSYAAGFQFESVTGWTYLLTQAEVLFHYLKLVFWPVDLSLDYSDLKAVQSVWKVLPHGLFWICLLGFSFWGAIRGRILGFVGLWFFLILAPSSSFVPVVTELAAERRMYVPLLSFATLVGGALFWVLRCYSFLPAAMMVFLCAALGWSAWERNSQYQTEKSIWTDVLNKRPNSVRALNNLSVIAGSERDYQLAETYIHRAIELNPKQYVESLTNYTVSLELITNYAVSLAGQGKLRDAQAIFNLIFTVDWKEDQSESLALAHFNYAKVMEQAGDLSLASQEYQKALELDSGLAQARFNLGLVFVKQRKTEDAEGVFKSLLTIEALQPKILLPIIKSKALFELAQIELQNGASQAAQAYLEQAISINPNYEEARLALDQIKV